VTFASGLHLQPPRRGATPANGGSGPRVLVSYGSGDAGSRVLVLTLEEVEGLFKAGPPRAG
jgi:hypothetical protein